MFDAVDYQLHWPPAMLAHEATALLSTRPRTNLKWWDRADRLLTEAFVGPRAVHDLQAVKPYTTIRRDGVVNDHDSIDSGLAYVTQLVDAIDQLPPPGPRRPYWRERTTGAVPHPQPETDTRQRFALLIAELGGNDYFEQIWPRFCEVNEVEGKDPNEYLDQLGVRGLWPLTDSWPDWDQDLFYELIEVLHDVVAWPRDRIDHQYVCRHGADFSAETGRIWYRYRVNALLDERQTPYRLATDGEDTGRLVAVTGDTRDKLVEAMVARTNPDNGDDVRHALKLFRARDATVQDKRSAILELIGVLEPHRKLLEEDLLDESEQRGAGPENQLFNIANNFNFRHRDLNQQRTYDPVFLDWLFWWYLATVELTDRLLARQEAEGPA